MSKRTAAIPLDVLWLCRVHDVMLAALEKIEWQYVMLFDSEWCPDCGNPRHDGHNDGCGIAAAIKAAKGGE